MADPLDEVIARPQYTPGFLGNSFGLTLKEAQDILDRANGDRNTAAELARQLRYKQP